MRVIADIETDGLLDTVTKIHCLSYQIEETDYVKSITNYQEMVEFLSQEDLTVIGHNFIRFDKPALEKILGVKFNFKIIDTLPLSWVLYPGEGKKHGLEQWGERLGIKKPEIESFVGISDEKLGIIKYFEELYPHEKL